MRTALSTHVAQTRGSLETYYSALETRASTRNREASQMCISSLHIRKYVARTNRQNIQTQCVSKQDYIANFNPLQSTQ